MRSHVGLGKFSTPWATIGCVISSLGLALSPVLSAHAEYVRRAVFDGEVWRLGTSSFVHFGVAHLFWNVLVVALVGAWAEARAPQLTRTYLAVAPWCVGCSLFFAAPALNQYRGLSGVAVGLVALVAWQRVKAGDRWIGIALILLIVGKIGLEIYSDRPLVAKFATTDIHPMPLAHVAGVVLAAMLVVLTESTKSQLNRLAGRECL